MKATKAGWVPLTWLLSACASSGVAGTHQGTTDGGQSDALVHPPLPDSSADSGADAGRCESVPGTPADFFIGLTTEMKYDGPVVADVVDGGALELVPIADAGGVRAVFGGVAPAIPPETSLWAHLDRYTIHSNPFNSTVTYGARVSVGEHGPVLAQVLHTFVPAAASAMEFLGATATFERACTRREETNLVTHESCLATDYYSMTVHGDSDVTLMSGATGHVQVGGIEYEVWLGSAFVESMDLAVTPCVADWGPPAGLDLAARAARYEDVLRGTAKDAGRD